MKPQPIGWGFLLQFVLGLSNLTQNIRMKSLLFFSLFCLSPSLVDAQCTIDPNNVYSFMYDGKLYEIVKENQTWTAAAQCVVDQNTLYYIIEHPVNTTGFPVIPKGNFLLYPNPSNGELTIDCTEDSEDLIYQLLDQSGRVVQTGKLTDHTQIQLPETAGLYTVQFLDGDQFLKAVKVTRQ